MRGAFCLFCFLSFFLFYFCFLKKLGILMDLMVLILCFPPVFGGFQGLGLDIVFL